MSAALTTQMLTPSLRRVYRSRAACTAISSSGACSEPTCTWLSPRLPRTNTSYSGQSRRLTAGFGSTGTSGEMGTAPWPPSAVRSDIGVLRGVRGRGLDHPGVVVPRGAPAADALGVGRAVAGDDPLELVPVDCAEPVVAGLVVVGQLGVGQRDAEQLGLRDGHVDVALAQLVVAVALDSPGHRLRAVGAVVVRRAEHHQRGPPPPVDGVLHHRPLLGGAAHHRHQELVALPLVEGLLLADADHRA